MFILKGEIVPRDVPVVMSSPNAFIYRVENLGTIKSTLENLEVKVGEFESDGEVVERRLFSFIPTRRITNITNDVINSVRRGFLIFQEMESYGWLREHRRIRDYYARYYLMDTDEGFLLVISAKKNVSQHIARTLTSFGLLLQNINLDRSVQDRIMNRRDIIEYRAKIIDETDPDIASIDVRARTPSTHLMRTQYGPQMDRRGYNRDMTFTLAEDQLRHKLTFTVKYMGSISIKHPQVNESWFLEIIDIVLQALR